MPSSRGSFQLRDQICIAGKFFTIWADIDQIKLSLSLKLSDDFTLHLEKKFRFSSFESEKPQWFPPTLHCLSNSSHTTLFIHWAQGKLALSLFLKCSKVSPGLGPLHQPCLCLQCVPPYLGRAGASSTLSDVTSSDNPCQKPTHSLAIMETYYNSLCSSCYLLIDFLFVSLVTACPVLWEENLCETAGIFQSTLFLVLACRSHATNTCCLNWKRTPDHQKWTKEPYLGGTFISTESQDCLTKICWYSEAHQPGQREWGETGQAQHKTLNPFLKDPNCLDLQRPQDPLEKKRTTHSSILAWKIPWTEEPGGL